MKLSVRLTAQLVSRRYLEQNSEFSAVSHRFVKEWANKHPAKAQLAHGRKGDAGDQIGKALNALAEEEFRLLGEYVREWNTKPKSCHIAQFVLSRVLRLPPTKILEVPLCFPPKY
ncbi:hypothetical protein RND71_008866 [Anisodus tanguticus]|uniref:U3 small nucleolar RNA-associated protein 13 C-terminal domain-containing protein n=1 Tax=Anisodus tanguticus TaxID=243964 RepID=A0AAE1SP69_9SOLA|nr:hypothetical protein RND71_008866 [Anisodus tanguticus]